MGIKLQQYYSRYTLTFELTNYCRSEQREWEMPLYSSFSRDFSFRPPKLPRLSEIQKPKTPITETQSQREGKQGLSRADSLNLSSAKFSPSSSRMHSSRSLGPRSPQGMSGKETSFACCLLPVVCCLSAVVLIVTHDGLVCS